MTQYKNQYGTIFAVKEHGGAPAIMCRAEHSETWSLSSMITPFTPGAWTAEELQGQLDNWAATKGWQAVEEPDSTEPRETVDEGSGPEDGFPDWVRPIAEEFLRFPFFRELPAFTATALRNSEIARAHQGGTIAEGLYDTYPKGISFAGFYGDNDSKHRIASYTWADFVRRCKAAGLAPELPHQDKEDGSCKPKTPAPTGVAAATTDGSAATQTEEETTTTSESEADASSLTSVLSGNTGLSSSPAPDCPAVDGDATQDLCAAPPASSAAPLPAFDYSGLDGQTVQDLHLAEREVSTGKRMAEIGLRRMADGVAIAHDALCGACDNLSQAHNNQHSEKTFGRWCDSVGLNRKAAERLLQVSKLFDDSTPREQKVLEELGPSLLYAAAKPSAPAELVQAVKDGDITTHKQYRDLLARYTAEHAAREQAEQQRDEAVTHIQAARDLQIDTARERDNALQRATAAENRAAGAHKLAEQRGDENASLKAQIRELESRPVEVAVAQPGEEQIEAWRKEGADRAAAALQDSVLKAHKEMVAAQNQVADLQDQLAAARPDADACQRTADTLYETTENLRLLLRTQLRQAQLTPKDYGNVVAHVLQAADALRDTVRSCAPAGYDFDSEEDDDFE